MNQLINEYDYSDSTGEERKASSDIKLVVLGLIKVIWATFSYSSTSFAIFLLISENGQEKEGESQ